MLPRFLHPFDVTPQEAKKIQEDLCCLVEPRGHLKKMDLILGVDVSFRAEDGSVHACLVAFSIPEGRTLEVVTAEGKATFPYVPGLLAFREGPIVLAALEKLRLEPDVLLFDAQGLAHPRRMGLATHLGILLDRPSVGCAKSHLYGEYEHPPMKRGFWSPIRDRNGDILGAVLRTRDGVSPVYVSVGHKIDLKTAITLVIKTSPRFRIPEPLRLAHRLSRG